MAAEAAELATASFGDRMLGAIGSTYKAQADISLGGVLDGSLAALRWAVQQQSEPWRGEAVGCPAERAAAARRLPINRSTAALPAGPRGRASNPSSPPPAWCAAGPPLSLCR